jgi:hypothetical protein
MTMAVAEVPVVQATTVLLRSMYLKKLMGNKEPNPREASLLQRIEHASLLRVFVDPSISIDFPNSNYIPPRIELELAYSCMSGKSIDRGMTDRYLLLLVYNQIHKVSSRNRLSTI